MPLSTRSGNTTNNGSAKASAEPKKKRAKATKSKSNLNNITTSSTENDESLSTNANPPHPVVSRTSSKTSASSESTKNLANIVEDKIEPAKEAAEVMPEPIPTVTAKQMKKFNSTLNSTVNTTINNMCEDTMMTDVSHTTDATHLNLPELVTSFCRNSKPGFVLACGENLSNQLGMGMDVNDRKKPQVVKELPTNVIQIAAGGMHSACLTHDGLVYTWGCNDEFALGRDNDEDIDKVNLPEKCIEITAGDSHTAALSESGIVYAWGTFRDGSGVLGLEQKKIAKTPMQFKLREKIAKISSGADHLVFLTITGEVYTAGNSEHGQLGRISKYNSCRGGRRGCDMILVPGLVRFPKRKELSGHKQIEDIWTTSYCTFLKVKDSDLIVGFGLNNCFQLGCIDAENRYQPDVLANLKFESKLKKVIGGMHHTLFLDQNGNVYSMGSHRYGGLGLGKLEADVNTPTRINDLKDIIDIASNTNVSYAIDKNGKVFNWGTNYSKQLGQDTEEDYYVPTKLTSKQIDARDVYTVSIGGQHALFVVSDEKDQDSDID